MPEDDLLSQDKFNYCTLLIITKVLYIQILIKSAKVPVDNFIVITCVCVYACTYAGYVFMYVCTCVYIVIVLILVFSFSVALLTTRFPMAIQIHCCQPCQLATTPSGRRKLVSYFNL